MVNSSKDLRQLYQSAKKIAASSDIDELLNNLLEDLLNNVQFERIVLLRLNPTDLSLVTEKSHGFEEPHHIPKNLPFTADSGLLHQVYTDREPLNLIRPAEGIHSLISSTLLSDSDKIPENGANRRTNIKLYVSAPDSSNAEVSNQKNYQPFSTVLFDDHDDNISTLLGTVDSFLILPISDQYNFYGFIIADKSHSGGTISYHEVRLSCSLTNHYAHALCRAREHTQMLTQISTQSQEIDYLETHCQSIIYNLRSGLIIVDQLMNITEMNPTAEIILGYREDELINKPIDFLLEGDQDDYECLFLDLDDKLDSDMGLLTETSMHKKNGQLFQAEICFSVITDRHDNIQGLSCIFRDITTRKAMERDLARNDKLSSLGELAGGIAHEIKNPLAGIGGAIQIIARNHDKDSPHGYIFNEVLQQVNRLDSFVDGLLKFARPGKTNFDSVDPKNLIEKVLLATISKLNDKDITVITSFSDNLPLIQGDATQLQIVFSNILENAIEAIDNKGTISIKTFSDFNSRKTPQHDTCCSIPGCNTVAGKFTVAFTDSGKGIDNKSLEVIFNPFHTTKSHGTGLGLSISHRIIEQHSGTISVQSRLGQGTTFAIQLPICCATTKNTPGSALTA
ncbi:MAG: ATP-binding protein [Thermodesulfobacteriota bacterium]|nr:ATP-binding protein [Thermodesulfobacteriota bacterium]